jgi:hypothetical protein
MEESIFVYSILDKLTTLEINNKVKSKNEDNKKNNKNNNKNNNNEMKKKKKDNIDDSEKKRKLDNPEEIVTLKKTKLTKK